MLEGVKFGWNFGMLQKCFKQAGKAYHSKQPSLAIVHAEKALNYGKKALSLIDKVNPGERKAFEGIVEKVEEWCQAVKREQSTQQSPEEKELRLAVKKQLVEMGNQMTTPGANQADFVADRMVDMYRIAKDRLGAGEKVLRMIYIDNESVPEPLRKVIGAYLDGNITKEEAERRLDELATKTKQYVSELGANQEAAERPQAILHGQATPENKLKSDLVAESMKDDGSIDQRQLFLNLAEIVLFDEWAGLSKQIGDRDPTFEELLKAQLSAFRRTYEKNKQGFASEKEFEDWVNRFSTTLKGNPKGYTSAAIPAYKTVRETVAKH